MQIPNLIDLITQRVNSMDEEDAKAFFQISAKPNKTWLSRIEPGVLAAQAVLGPYIAEQTTGDATLGDQGKTIANQRMVDLLFSVFGANATPILETVARDLEAGRGPLRLIFDKIEDKGISIKIEYGEPEDKIEEPKEGLIPLPQASPDDPTDLDELVRALAPRVRLEGQEANALSVLGAVNKGKWSRRVSMLIPMYNDVAPRVVYSLMAHIRKQPWMGVHVEYETVIQRARNRLAQKFLQSEAEWSFWVDSDMIVPFGDPGFFYLDLGVDKNYITDRFAGMMAVDRLMKAGHTIVGGVYQARKIDNIKTKSPMVIQPCMHPRHKGDSDLVDELRARGPIDKVVQVGYVATGCALVHRSVYQAIMDRFPERKPKNPAEPFDFFGHDIAKSGEDIAFCGLAAEAGHQSYLDCGLWCAHLGRYAYFPTK